LIVAVAGYYIFAIAGISGAIATDFHAGPVGSAITVYLFCTGALLADIAMEVGITPPPKGFISSSGNSAKKQTGSVPIQSSTVSPQP